MRNEECGMMSEKHLTRERSTFDKLRASLPLSRALETTNKAAPQVGDGC